MKSPDEGLLLHLDRELTTLAELVKITRKDGAVVAFTTHDRDLELGGVTYKAGGIFSCEEWRSDADARRNSHEVAGALESGEISEDDLRSGRFDGASVEISICDWADLSFGTLTIKKGRIGDVVFSAGKYAAEVNGFAEKMRKRVGDIYTPECRHGFCDKSCGLDVRQYISAGEATFAAGASAFTDSGRTEPDGAFDYGKIVWKTGANAGLESEVKGWDSVCKTITLRLPLPFDISVGDEYDIYKGCDKRFATCAGTYANAANFGGFPHLPGVGKILAYPDSK